MQGSKIDVFAEVLVRLVRDRAIRNCRTRLTPDTRSPIGKHWVSVVSAGNLEQIGDAIIPDCIDESIFCLLNAIDEGGLRLTFTEPDDQKVDLSVDGLGELAGWYMGGESWRERFSQERINNYLA
jgi:hypothetical protein